jgi:hypothetical protein
MIDLRNLSVGVTSQIYLKRKQQMKNTDYAVGEVTPVSEATPVRNAIVYSHAFNNGAKYFGNGVKQSRPYEFGSGRGKKYQEQFELDPNPTVTITASDLTVEEADELEQQLFDEYIANGGLKIQRRPSGKDLSRSITSSAKVDPANISKALTGENNPMWDKKHTEVAKIKISKSMIGNTNSSCSRSQAFKEKISKAKTGVPKSKEHKEALRKPKAKNPNYKVISMLDGRVTGHNYENYWNRQNPDYIGTWVRL